MREFWDARARENAVFFVDTRQDYRAPDLARFWEDGRRDLDCMLELLGVEVGPGDVVLDVGCGVGRLTRALAARARSVVALDVSPRMLALAREHNHQLDNVRWVHGDGVSLRPLADASADACISLVVFQHIPDPDVTLGYVREMARVLRPGGWAAFHVSTDPRVHRRRGGLAQRLRALVRRAPRGQRDARWLGAPLDLDAVHRTAGEAGLDVERVVNPGEQFCAVLARRRAVDGGDRGTGERAAEGEGMLAGDRVAGGNDAAPAG
jgi:SAM-dependent methyltransferase